VVGDWSSDVCSSDLLSVGGPTVRMTEKKLSEIIPLVRKTAERISAKLGYQKT